MKPLPTAPTTTYEEFSKACAEAAEKLEAMTPEEIDKLFPKHTGSTIIVGGVRPSCPDHPNYWKGPRKVWCCPKDCPACKRDKEFKDKHPAWYG
jgi:hypothetical protein